MIVQINTLFVGLERDDATRRVKYQIRSDYGNNPQKQREVEGWKALDILHVELHE